MIATRPPVLVVDDMADTRRLMRRVLEPAGLRVAEAATGEAALPDVRREALDAGCDAFEGKPFDIRSFADLLLGLIARRAPG